MSDCHWFVTRRVVKKAVRWDGTNVDEMADFAGDRAKVKAEGERKALVIETLEGTMIGEPGDWIIRGVNGEFYPCKPDIFAKTYEPFEKVTVGEPSSAPPDVNVLLKEIEQNGQMFIDEKALILRQRNDIAHLKALLRCDPEETIDDGFGGVWSRTCPTCGLGTMRVNSPGEVQCDYCDPISGAAQEVSPPSPEPCGEPAASFIPRRGMSFACVLPKGHEGEHKQGGNCFRHGAYVGALCPRWPSCLQSSGGVTR